MDKNPFINRFQISDPQMRYKDFRNYSATCHCKLWNRGFSPATTTYGAKAPVPEVKKQILIPSRGLLKLQIFKGKNIVPVGDYTAGHDFLYSGTNTTNVTTIGLIGIVVIAIVEINIPGIVRVIRVGGSRPVIGRLTIVHPLSACLAADPPPFGPGHAGDKRLYAYTRIAPGGTNAL